MFVCNLITPNNVIGLMYTTKVSGDKSPAFQVRIEAVKRP